MLFRHRLDTLRDLRSSTRSPVRCTILASKGGVHSLVGSDGGATRGRPHNAADTASVHPPWCACWKGTHHDALVSGIDGPCYGTFGLMSSMIHCA